jgi:hypothetical protein
MVPGVVWEVLIKKRRQNFILRLISAALKLFILERRADRVFPGH